MAADSCGNGCHGSHCNTPNHSASSDSDATVNDEGPMAPIARFMSAAEAGYFAHELMDRNQIPARVTGIDDFDASSGAWTTRFVLSVPEETAVVASATFKEWLQQDASSGHEDRHDGESESAVMAELAPDDENAEASRASASAGVGWGPIILALIAGGGIFWLAQHDKPNRQRAQVDLPGEQVSVSFWNCLLDSPGPWVQTIGDGPGVRQIVIEPERGVVIVREDLDGDGQFDQELPFRRVDLAK